MWTVISILGGAVLLGILIFGLIQDRAATARAAEERELFVMARYYKTIEDHGQTLRLRVRQAAYHDPYGRRMLDKCYKELQYFHGNILIPALSPLSAEEFELVSDVYAEWTQWMYDERFWSDSDEAQAWTDGVSYERVVADLLTKEGFQVRFTPVTGDQGVDLIAERDGMRLAVQCKAYAKHVGNDAVQQVFAGAKFYDANISAVVAPNGFTVAARQLANSLGVRCIHHTEARSLIAQSPFDCTDVRLGSA